VGARLALVPATRQTGLSTAEYGIPPSIPLLAPPNGIHMLEAFLCMDKPEHYLGDRLIIHGRMRGWLGFVFAKRFTCVHSAANSLIRDLFRTARAYSYVMPQARRAQAGGELPCRGRRFGWASARDDSKDYIRSGKAHAIRAFPAFDSGFSLNR